MNLKPLVRVSRRECVFPAVWQNAINGKMCFSSLMIARHYRLLSVSNETPLEKIMRFNNMLTALTGRQNVRTCAIITTEKLIMESEFSY